jgi:hypothetical protein
MRAIDLKRKYPKLWKYMYDSVYDDLRLQKKINGFIMKDKDAKIIAHNAAFFATHYVHFKGII